MDVALKETADYTRVAADKNDDIIFDESRAHFSIKSVIVNNSTTPLYAKTKDGYLHKIPQRQIMGHFSREPDIRVLTRYTSRQVNRESKREECRYRLNPSNLVKGCVVYLKELAVYISVDRELLLNLPIMDDTRVADRLRDSISSAFAGMIQCPISVIINDPTDRLKYVYGVLDEQVYKIPVLHTTTYGKTCIVKFAGIDSIDSESYFDFSLDEMLTSFGERGNYCPTVGQYKFTLFSSATAAQDAVEQKRVDNTKRAMGISAREREAIKLEYDGKLQDLQLQIKQRDREIEVLKTTLGIFEATAKQGEAQVTRDHAKSIQSLQLEKENARVQKSHSDVSAASLGYSATALKTAAVVAPIIVGVIGLAATKVGVAAVPVLGIAGGFKLVTSVAATVCTAVATGVSSIVGSIGSAISKGVGALCGWVSSWF